MGDEEVPVPSVIKHTHYKYWAMLVVLFAVVGILKCVAQDIMVGLVLGIMSVLIWCNLKDDCRRMNQCQLLWIGMLCLIQAMFELITLATSVGGRTSRVQTTAPTVTEGDKSTTVVTVTTEKHDFFDKDEGFLYNLQSSMMIVTSVTMLLGVLMAYLSYNAYETSLFASIDAASNGADMGGYGSYGGAYGGPNSFQGRGTTGTAGPRPGGGGGGGPVQRGPTTQVFGGAGNRLGG